MEYQHTPVLLQEVIQLLEPKPGQRVVDCTLGAGGYTIALLGATAPNGQVMGIDLDPAAHAAVRERLGAADAKRFIGVEGNFANITQLVADAGWEKVDSVVMDLGLSSGQLSDDSRGFSFRGSGDLDMRFGKGVGTLTAGQIINAWGEVQIAEILFRYGEERASRPIAKAIVAQRETEPIESAEVLAEIVSKVYRRRYHSRSLIHPATKVFQALRIAVNHEMENLEQALPAALELLVSGGRLAVVSYHSLEDRMVKQFFRSQARGCICPPEQPTCTCNHTPEVKLITKKAVRASAQEISENPRSRSALLRVVEKT
jgi:16S rRNA (cytosine1402-N4)-methyltransferase